VAHGAPHLGLPGLSSAAITDLAPLAGVVALVVVTQSASTCRAFVDRSRPVRQDVGRDLLGVGAGSAVAGLVGAFPVDASPARTGAVMEAGGRTQAAGLWAVAGTIATIPALGLLANLPLATLAALLIYVATRLFHFHDLEAIRRFDALEFALALVTLLTVALVGVPQGITVAIGLAILDRTRLSARPQLHVLGRLPGTPSWTTTAIDTELEQVPGVLVLLFASPLWYANAVRFQSEVRDAISASPTAPRAVVLDALGMTDIDYTGMQALTACSTISTAPTSPLRSRARARMPARTSSAAACWTGSAENGCSPASRPRCAPSRRAATPLLNGRATRPVPDRSAAGSSTAGLTAPAAPRGSAARVSAPRCRRCHLRAPHQPEPQPADRLGRPHRQAGPVARAGRRADGRRALGDDPPQHRGPRAADDESRSHAERRERFAHRPVVAADHREGPRQ
jgi:hypothetical protein